MAGMGVRAQIGWFLHGGPRTAASLRDLGAEVADLQRKVEALTSVVARLDASLPPIAADAATGAASLTAMKEQLRIITDDLGDRVGAVAARLDTMR